MPTALPVAAGVLGYHEMDTLKADDHKTPLHCRGCPSHEVAIFLEIARARLYKT